MITKAECTKKIAAYLGGEISHGDPLKWADTALVEENFPEKDGRLLLGILSDLAAGRTAGILTQVESYQAILRELGFRAENACGRGVTLFLPSSETPSPIIFPLHLRARGKPQ